MTLEEVLKYVKENEGDITAIITEIQKTSKGEEFLNDHANAHFEKEIKPRIAKIYGDFEDDWFEITGERKPEGVKTYDWFKDKAKELKGLKDDKGGDKDDKIKTLESTIEQLKKEGGQNDYWKKTHEEAVSKFEEKEKDYKSTIENLQTSQTENQVKSFLDSGLSKLEFSVPQEAVDALKQVHSTNILGNAKIIDGKVVLHDKDGNPMLNSHYKPMTAEDFWKDKLSSVIKKPNQGGGGAPAGNKGDIITTGEGDDAKKRLVLDKAQFNSKRDFTETAGKFLIEKGVERNSKEWNQLIDGAYQDYGVKDLPIQ
jgi:hypothetical protein